MAKRYDAFISYKHGSILPFSKMLVRSLRTYARPLFAPPRNIFRDEDHLVPSASLPEVIRRALESSEYLVLLASPEAATSPWVCRELQTWCDELNRVERIIIVLVEGSLEVDPSGAAIDWARTNALPLMLERHLADVPLFVDLRCLSSVHELDENNPAFKAAITQIVARLHGVDPQEMLGYELLQHRRRIRIRNVAIGLLAILTATSVGGGLYANHQRAEQQSAANAAIASSLATQVRSSPTRSQDERNALVARQAYLFAGRSGNPMANSVSEALRTAVSPDYFTTSLPVGIGFVSHVAASASGHVIASAGESNLIRVWDSRLPGGSKTLTLEPGIGVSALAVDALGQRLVVGGREDGSVRLWSLSQLGSGPSAPTLLSRHGGAVTALAFDGSGARLASASIDGTVRIWNFGTTKAQPQVLGHTDEVIAVAFVGDRVFTGTANDGLQAWSHDGTAVTPLRSWPGSKVSVLKISASGHWAAFANFGTDVVRLYDLRDPLGRAILLKSPAGEVTTVAFSNSEEQLVAGTSTGDILIWTLGVADQAIRIPSGHGTSVTGLAFFDGGAIVSSGRQDGQIRIRYLRPGLPVSRRLSGTLGARFGNDDEQILGLDEKNRPALRVLSSVSSSAPILDVSVPAGTEWYPTRDGFVSLDFANKSGAVWPAKPAMTPVQRFSFAEYMGNQMSSVVVSDDGRMVAWVDSYDTSAWLVDLTLPNPAALKLGDEPIRNTLWSPIAADGTPTDVLSLGVRQWSAPVAISPDKRRLAIGAGDGTVRVWTLSDRQALPLVLRALGRWPLSLAFSSDGDMIAAGSTQRTIGVWSFSEERSITLRGHEDRVDAVAFAPNRRLLASGGPDGTVRVWDLDDEDPQPMVLDGEESAMIDSIKFSPSGQRLVVSSEESSHVWIISGDMLAEHICAVVSRNLSIDEWLGFVGPDFGYERTCPNLPVHQSLLEAARTLVKTGALEEAESLVARAMSLDPEHTGDWTAEINRAVADGRLAEAEELARAGEVDAAVALIKESLSHGATLASAPDLHARRLAAEGLLAQAQRLTRTDDLDKAVVLLARSIQLVPTADAYASRGAALATLGETDKAIADFDRSLSIDPDQWEIHAQRAELLGSRQDWNAQLEGYSRALELIRDAKRRFGKVPSNMLGIGDFSTRMLLSTTVGEQNVLLARASTSFRLGDFAGAIADYNWILSANPGNADALYGRGVAHRANGRCDKAIADVTALLERDAKDWNALVLRAVCLRDVGSYVEGLRDLKAALDANVRLTAEQQDWINELEQALAQDAFAARDYRRAMSTQRDRVERIKAQADRPKLAEEMGALSYYALFARDFFQAKEAAEQGLSLDPGQRWIEGNLAHALMFIGETEKARTLYLANQGVTIGEGRSWEKEVLADFRMLQEAGVNDPLIPEIETRFAPGG